MKRFLVENIKKGTTIKVVLHSPPYENENVLYKTGYKVKDCKITEIINDVSLYWYKSIDNEHDERESSLMGAKPKKIKKIKGKK